MIFFVVGTRPDIIKMGPLIERVKSVSPIHVLHTGQHWSEELDSKVCKQAGVVIDHRIDVGEDSDAPMAVHRVYSGIYEYISNCAVPDWGPLVVYGDTLSAMSAAIAGKGRGLPVVHVEAGLRARDTQMPEEIARITIDAIADRLYAPMEQHADNLMDEGIDESKVIVTGNVIVDALRRVEQVAYGEPSAPDAMQAVGRKKFVLLTLHRPENVDRFEVVDKILGFAQALCVPRGIELIFWPAHPRGWEVANAWWKRRGTEGVPGITVSTPMGYSDMIWLQREAEFVMTDSGGLQEECALLGQKCITFRKSTERQETVDSGHNLLISPLTHDFQAMMSLALKHLSEPEPSRATYYGDHPTEEIALDLLNWQEWWNRGSEKVRSVANN